MKRIRQKKAVRTWGENAKKNVKKTEILLEMNNETEQIFLLNPTESQPAAAQKLDEASVTPQGMYCERHCFVLSPLTCV